KVVLRGNFHTAASILRHQLHLEEGELLTEDALAEAARQLRLTGLFNAVSIDLPDLEGRSPVINAVVHVEERYDNLAELELQGGYSTYQGAFFTTIGRLNNLLGRGISLTGTFTDGTKIFDLEGQLRFPQYLLGDIFTVDVTGLYKQQLT